MLIAIVDDEPMVLKSMARVIEEKYPEIKVVCCRNAYDTLEVIKEVDLDAVVTDVCMPGMDGIEICCKIHEIKPDTEVVMISGYSDFEYVKRAMSYGVKQYILKPINSTKLAELIDYLKKTECEKNGEKELRRRIGLNEIEQNLNNMLRSGDIEGMRGIIFPHDISYKNGGVIKSYAVFLINILMFFVKSNNLENMNDTDMFEEVTSKTTDDLMLGYVFEKYTEIAERLKAVNEKTDVKALEIRNYIDRNYGSMTLSREMLAEKFGLSVRHMSRIFTKQYNKGVQEYIMDVRLEHAKQLLLNSKLSLAEITAMVGYSSQSYFKRLFKEQTGCTMTDYRNGGKNNASAE